MSQYDTVCWAKVRPFPCNMDFMILKFFEFSDSRVCIFDCASSFDANYNSIFWEFVLTNNRISQPEN